MSVTDDFDAATNELETGRDVDSCLDSLQHGDTERLLDDLLGRHEDDDFPAFRTSDSLISFED
jgi:hypothetical protein